MPSVNFGPGNDFGRSYGLLSIQPAKDEFVDSVVAAFRLGLQRDVNVASDSIQIFKQGTGYHCSPSNEPTFAVTPEGHVRTAAKFLWKKIPPHRNSFTARSLTTGWKLMPNKRNA